MGIVLRKRFGELSLANIRTPPFCLSLRAPKGPALSPDKGREAIPPFWDHFRHVPSFLPDTLTPFAPFSLT